MHPAKNLIHPVLPWSTSFFKTETTYQIRPKLPKAKQLGFYQYSCRKKVRICCAIAILFYLDKFYLDVPSFLLWQWSIISRSVMIIIFVEFIDQLIDYLINCASLNIDHPFYDLTLKMSCLISIRKIKLQSSLPMVFFFFFFERPFTLVLLNPDIPYLCKQCRSRSVGFSRSQLNWICTVCH